ncbi:LysR family transcriptional regulator [Brevundimonas vancanneytii]|uniref:LysR family transcriptional regulator n=2 Tax=Brevundimonas TaxID=41275 RepID=UPI0034D73DA7
MHSTERLKGIEVFVVAAELLSFTAAAERLHLTASAVSKSVARLEQRLAVRLFERTTRRLALTAAGAAFYATCTGVLSELADAEATLAAEASTFVGRIKIDVPVAFGRMRVLPLLLKFAELYPQIRPEISFTDRFVDVLDDAVDVAVRIGGVDDLPETLDTHYLGSEKVIFCAAPSYVLRVGYPQDIEALLHLDGVFYRRANGAIAPWRLDDASPVRGKQSPRLVLGSAEAQVEAVKAGFGVAQLATWLIRGELESGALIDLAPNHAAAGLPAHLIWARNRRLTPKVDALINALKDDLRIDEA